MRKTNQTPRYLLEGKYRMGFFEQSTSFQKINCAHLSASERLNGHHLYSSSMESDPPSPRTLAETILRTCAGLKRGERILIAADPRSSSRLQELKQTSLGLGGIMTYEEIFGGVTREPPGHLAAKMLENDITLLCVDERRTLLWGHADARVAAVKKGARVLFLTQEINTTPSTPELQEIRNRTNRLGDMLEKTSEIVIVSGGDSELRVKLAGRKSLRLSSILSEPGSWGAIPDYAEAAIPPFETGSNGTLRVDATIVGIGKVDAPVDLHFESGRLVRIEGDKTALELEKLLSQHDAYARVLCELGFGTNHLRTQIKGEFDDKKALGSVHIGLGDNHTFGGKNKSDLHIDCLVSNPKIHFDGNLIDLKSI
ncbi:MAG: aminopeptidase [Nitrososphaerota archaeon]|nr:aminopeptidase [Nitrososphaerota archaeon]